MYTSLDKIWTKSRADKTKVDEYKGSIKNESCKTMEGENGNGAIKPLLLILTESNKYFLSLVRQT